MKTLAAVYNGLTYNMNHRLTSNRFLRNKKGMTLIEIMIVLVIIGGLTAILATKITGQLVKARNDEAKIQIRELGKQLDLFFRDCGSYPTTEQGLKALVEPVSDCPNWGPTPYISKIPKDPWNHEFTYERKSSSAYTLISLGQEGKEGSPTAISSEDL